MYYIISSQAKHATIGNTTWGVDGENGEIVNMSEKGVWDTYSVKAQTYKTALEVSIYTTIDPYRKKQIHYQIHHTDISKITVFVKIAFKLTKL